MRALALVIPISSALLSVAPAAPSPKTQPTLNDLKKLEIICFVPAYLPKGFHLTNIAINEEEDPSGEMKRRFPLYNIEYQGPGKATFSIESAREGIGDRNIMETDDSEETELTSPLFGSVYIIYTPKGKTGAKKEIIANWVRDANMVAETATDEATHPILGRFHGFSATGITVAEFSRIIASLHPVRPIDGTPTSSPAASVETPPKLHPKIFSMIDNWVSDSECPVVTEINLEAVAKDDNEFQQDEVKEEAGWRRCPGPDSGSFMRYRLLESKGNHYKAEYQENGGGSLTTSTIIEFTIEKREIEKDGHPAPITVLRVVSCRAKMNGENQGDRP
jgi:hypothetical protein